LPHNSLHGVSGWIRAPEKNQEDRRDTVGDEDGEKNIDKNALPSLNDEAEEEERQ